MKKLTKKDIKDHVRENYYHDFKEGVIAEEYEHHSSSDLRHMIEEDTDSLCYFLKHKGITIEE